MNKKNITPPQIYMEASRRADYKLNNDYSSDTYSERHLAAQTELLEGIMTLLLNVCEKLEEIRMEI